MQIHVIILSSTDNRACSVYGLSSHFKARLILPAAILQKFDLNEAENCNSNV